MSSGVKNLHLRVLLNRIVTDHGRTAARCGRRRRRFITRIAAACSSTSRRWRRSAVSRRRTAPTRISCLAGDRASRHRQAAGAALRRRLGSYTRDGNLIGPYRARHRDPRSRRRQRHLRIPDDLPSQIEHLRVARTTARTHGSPVEPKNRGVHPGDGRRARHAHPSGPTRDRGRPVPSDEEFTAWNKRWCRVLLQRHCHTRAVASDP